MVQRSAGTQLRSAMAMLPLTEAWLTEPEAFIEDWRRWLKAMHRSLDEHLPADEVRPSKAELTEAVYPLLALLLREGMTRELVLNLTVTLFGDRRAHHYDAVVDALLAAKPKAPRKVLDRRY